MANEPYAWQYADEPQEEIVDSAAEPTHYRDGSPVAVTVPIVLAPGIRVVYSTRLGGVSQGAYSSLNLGGHGGDNPQHVLSNRLGFARAVNAPLSLVSQVHSNIVADADALSATVMPYGQDASGFLLADGSQTTRVEADAQVSAQRGLALGMFAADCLPLFLADAEHGIIGAAHCGRAGLLSGIIEQTVAAMVDKGAERGNIVANLGPAICGDCYEVGEEIAAEFEKRFPLTTTQTRFGGVGINLAEAVRIDLAFAGITKEIAATPRVHAASEYLHDDEELARICLTDGLDDPDLVQRWDMVQHSMCTLENPLWHSHRRAVRAGVQNEGRMLAAIIQDVQ